MQEIKKKKIGTDKGANVFLAVMMALPILQFIIFYIVVNFNSIVLAFQYQDGLTGEFDWLEDPFQQFRIVFMMIEEDPFTQVAIKNSIFLGVLSIFIIMPITLLFSYYVYKKMHGGDFFKIMLFAPTIITSVVWVLIYKYFVNFGIRDFLGLFMKDPPPLIDDKPFASVTIFYIIFAFGSGLLLYLHAMTQISPSVVEAAEIDGASELRSFFSVIIPSIWPTIVSFLVINLSQIAVNQANLFTFFDFSADPDAQTIGYILFQYAARPGGYWYPLASAWGLFLTIIVAPLTGIVRFLANKFGPSDS